MSHSGNVYFIIKHVTSLFPKMINGLWPTCQIYLCIFHAFSFDVLFYVLEGKLSF